MTDISCQTGVELLMDYLEGVVPEDMRTILDSHVAGCPTCTVFVASYLATPRILRDATATAMPRGLEDRSKPSCVRSAATSHRRRTKRDFTYGRYVPFVAAGRGLSTFSEAVAHIRTWRRCLGPVRRTYLLATEPEPALRPSSSA